MRSKTIFPFLFLAFSFFGFSCHKNKVQEQLPPETQTGAGTFGFKIGNTVYKSEAPYPNAFATYLHLSDLYSNGYFFNVGGEDGTEWNILILTDSLAIFEGQTSHLNNDVFTKGEASAVFIGPQKEYYTRPNLQGELKISKLDNVHQIVSGTFWFDAVDTVSNTTVQIREGRFDLHYTQ